MAQVTRIEIEESGYRFTFVAKPREGFNSFVPFLVATTDLKSNIYDSQDIPDIPKGIRHRAYALAAIVFNKFKS